MRYVLTARVGDAVAEAEFHVRDAAGDLEQAERELAEAAEDVAESLQDETGSGGPVA